MIDFYKFFLASNIRNLLLGPIAFWIRLLMPASSEDNCMKISVIELRELLASEKMKIDGSGLESFDFVPISKMLTADDVWLIKKMKKEGKKVYLPVAEPVYSEMRGGEWELASMIISEAAKGVVIGLVSMWIYDKIANWRKAKNDNPGSGVKQPGVKLKFYFTKTKKYAEIEGESEAALKALDKLKKDEF